MRRVRGALVDGSLVVTCDALGGIGPRAGDVVPASGYVVGRFTARVALMELIALGAEPAALAVTLCMGDDEEVLRGVADEAGLPLTWSGEHNVAVAQTAVGVTAFGRAERLKVGGGRPGDPVLALGRPRVGAAVRLDDPTIADPARLRRLLPHCAAVAPAGHGGLGQRAAALAAEAGLRFVAESPADWDLAASAGPATALVAIAGDPAAAGHAAGLPWAVIGRLAPC